MDAFPIDDYIKREVKAIEVHYINETGPGEVLLIRRRDLDGGKYYIDGVRKNDGISVFNALVEWGDKKNEQQSSIQ